MKKRALDSMIQLATVKHAGMFDSRGMPYVLHLYAVINNLKRTDDEELMAIAFGHDLVEDTDVTTEQVRYQFGDRIADAIDAISKRDNEPYESYLSRVLCNPDAVLVKMADLEHNTLITRSRGSEPKDLERVAKYWKAYDRLVSQKKVHQIEATMKELFFFDSEE